MMNLNRRQFMQTLAAAAGIAALPASPAQLVAEDAPQVEHEALPELVEAALVEPTIQAGRWDVILNNKAYPLGRSGLSVRANYATAYPCADYHNGEILLGHEIEFSIPAFVDVNPAGPVEFWFPDGLGTRYGGKGQFAIFSVTLYGGGLVDTDCAIYCQELTCQPVNYANPRANA